MRLSDKILHSAVPSSGREVEEGGGGGKGVGWRVASPKCHRVHKYKRLVSQSDIQPRGESLGEQTHVWEKSRPPKPSFFFFFTVRFLADNGLRRRPPLSDKTGARGGGGSGGGDDEKPGGLFQSCKSRLKVNVLKPRSMKLSARNRGGGGRYVSPLPSAAT